MVVILIILMTSLIAIISQTLYRATLDMKKSSLIVISDSALTEALILLTNDPLWGKNNEKLFMKTEEPDMKIAGFNPLALPLANSEFDFENNSAYYISFDPNDPAFETNKCFSVNNLDRDTPAQSWRPGIEVPPRTADIVITVLEDGNVHHVEVFIMSSPDGGLQNGSRGTMIIDSNAFLLSGKYEPPALHSNYDDASTPNEVSVLFKNMLYTDIHIQKDGKISACDQIKVGSDFVDPNSDIFKVEEAPLDIPYISVSTLVSDITFETQKLPSGTYIPEWTGTTFLLRHTSDITGDITDYNSGEEIVPGLRFDAIPQPGGWVFPVVNISKNIEVAYDPNQENGTGNISIRTNINFEDGVNFYAPGTGEADPNTGEYNSGNIEIKPQMEGVICKITGRGNIYSMGTTGISMTAVEAGNITSEVALYSEGDLTLEYGAAAGKIEIQGLIYTNGDFTCRPPLSTMAPPTTPLRIEGALIAAGKDPDDDPGGFDPGNIDIKAGEVSINFDDTVLTTLNKYSFFSGGGGGGPTGRFRFVCWYEF